MEVLPKMMVNDFLNIFYSNSPLSIDWDSLEEIALMYEEGLVTLDVEVITSHDDFLKRLDYVNKPKNGFVRSGESYLHLALKSFARDYLKTLVVLESDILYEQNLDGFKVDVIDRGLRFPTECGDTNALKLEKYLFLPSTQTFLIIPYPRLNDVILYKFCAEKSFFKYVEFKSEYFQKIRSKLR